MNWKAKTISLFVLLILSSSSAEAFTAKHSVSSCKAIAPASTQQDVTIIRFIGSAIERRNLGDSYTMLFGPYKRWYHVSCQSWIRHPRVPTLKNIDYQKSGAKYIGGGDEQALYKVFLRVKGEKGYHFFDVELRQARANGPWFIDYWKAFTPTKKQIQTIVPSNPKGKKKASAPTA